MIDAKQARLKSSGTNNTAASLILNNINQRIERAADSGMTNVRINTENIPKAIVDGILEKLRTLGYIAKYDHFTPPQWDGGKTEYYFTINW